VSWEECWLQLRLLTFMEQRGKGIEMSHVRCSLGTQLTCHVEESHLRTLLGQPKPGPLSC